MERFSRKRQSILDCLRSTTEHPGADWIYERLKPSYPHLSLATVYRNLNQLKEEGLIRSVGIVNGQERFDAVTAPHTHAICTKCGRVIDIAGIPVPLDLAEEVRRLTGYSVTGADLQFTGICAACLSECSSEKDK